MKRMVNTSFNCYLRPISPSIGVALATFLVISSGQGQTFQPTSGTTQSWNTAANWSPATVPNSTGAAATFITPTATETVNYNANITVGSIGLTNNSAFVFTLLNGTGTSLTFAATSGNAAFTIGGTGTAVNQLGSSGTNETTSLTSTLDLTINDTAVTSSTGALQISGALTGAGGIIKDGAGTFSFATTAKTYTGSTVINSGILRTSATGLPTGTSGVTVNSGGTLSLATNSSTFQFGTSTATVITLNGAGATSLQGNTIGGDGALNNTNGSTILSNNVALASDSTVLTTATLTMSGTISGSGGLIKAGTSTLTLTGGNTYGGATTINAGTLNVAGASGKALGGTSAVNINSTGTVTMGAVNQFSATAPAPVTLTGATGAGNAATFKLASFSQGSATATGVGALTLATGSVSNVVDFGGVAGVVSFASLTTNSATLTINNYLNNNAAAGGSDQLIFNQDELTSLGNIVFTGYGATTEQLVSGMAGTGNAYYEVFPIAAVPEPGTILGGLIVFSAFAWKQRRRFSELVGLLWIDCAA